MNCSSTEVSIFRFYLWHENNEIGLLLDCIVLCIQFETKCT